MMDIFSAGQRADMEISSRTIILLILFVVLAVVIIGIGIILSTQSAGTVANYTNIAESFVPGA